MTLLDSTKELARTRAFDRAQVCREIGVSTKWLTRMLNGDFDDPGVNKIEKLHQLLAAAPAKDVAPENSGKPRARGQSFGQ